MAQFYRAAAPTVTLPSGGGFAASLLLTRTIRPASSPSFKYLRLPHTRQHLTNSMTRQYIKSVAPPAASNGVKTGPNVAEIVAGVIADVKQEGDVAVRRYSEKFDKWSPPSFRLSVRRFSRLNLATRRS